MSYRPFRAGPETTILAVLVLTLALSAVLAYNAHRAAGSHRQAAEAALRDYAAFASWRLESRLSDELSRTLRTAVNRARLPLEMAHVAAEAEGLRSVRMVQPPPDAGAARRRSALLGGDIGASPDLPAFESRVRRELERSGSGGAVREFFLLDLTEGAVTPEASLSKHLRDWLADELIPEDRNDFDASAGTGRFRFRGGGDGDAMIEVVGPLASPLVIRPFGDASTRVVYATLHDGSGSASTVYGFVLDVSELAMPLLASIIESVDFLPPSLTGGASNRDVLALRVGIAGGETLYDSGGGMPVDLAVVDTLHHEVATLVVDVAIRPEVAETLVIGGLPRSRLPLLLSLFALSLGLVGIAGVQLHRQRVLTRLRSDFIASVSHELRTPLAQIRLFSELLDTDRLRPEQEERSVRIINEESQRLAYLVENVLRFSGMERRTTRVAPETIEPAPLIRDVVESFTPLARSRGVEFELSLVEGLRAPLDPHALRQVLLNLLDNAVKYGPRGQVIEIAMDREAGWLRIAVSDQGPGVPPAERQRIWEPYQRLRRDVESATGGSGIGLAMVRELVELHGGRVSVMEAPGGGARFEVAFPDAGRSATRANGADASIDPREGSE